MLSLTRPARGRLQKLDRKNRSAVIAQVVGVTLSVGHDWKLVKRLVRVGAVLDRS